MDEDGSKIKIGANEIFVLDRDEYIEDSNLFGKFDPSQMNIVIDSYSCDQSRTMTLIHEMQHVFLFRAGLHFGPEFKQSVESIIDACASGFFDFFRERENLWAIAEILGVSEDSLRKCVDADKK